MTTARNAPTAAAERREVLLARRFSAPPSSVFAAWTHGPLLARWSAPAGFTIPEGAADLRPGGAWRVVMRAPDGTEHRARGVYREIVPGERLVLTHGWEEDGAGRHETTITVTFAPDGDGTSMVFHQMEFKSDQSRDGHESGWIECFDRLQSLLEERSKQE